MAAIRAFLSRTRTTPVVHFTRNIHHSTPLFHHLPRDPNVPYNPRWKPGPLFPPGFLEDARAKFNPFWDAYKDSVIFVGKCLGLVAIYDFEKGKEIEAERKVQFFDKNQKFLLAVEDFKIVVAAREQDKKVRSHKKEMVVNKLSEILDVNVVEKYKIAKKIMGDELLMVMFLEVSTEERKEILKGILGGDI